MKTQGKLGIAILLLTGLSMFNPLELNAANTNYITNKVPLKDVPFYPLPIGSVKAEGWLLNQMQNQLNGLTGNAEMLYNTNNDLGEGSDWLGGTGDSWERVPYYVKGATALAYILNDEGLKVKVKKWLDWTLNNQQIDGFIGPVKNTDWWPRMPMLYALRDYYDATADVRVIPFLTKYFQNQYDNLSTRTLDSWGKSRAGDNIEIVLWLYNHTGDAFLLNLADKLKSQAYDWTNIFSNNLFNSFGADFQPKHNVNVPQAMKMPVIYYQKSLNDADKDAWQKGFEHLMHDHGQPEGMQSGCEMLSGKSAMTGLEMCSIVEEMQSCETSQMILGDASIGDQLEKVAFNAFPGGYKKDFKASQYYTLANQLRSKFGNINFGQQYDNGILPGPYSGYGCCRFNLHMGWPYFVKNMWAATNDNGVAAMTYGPSSVTLKVADGKTISIREETNYPFGEDVKLTISSTADASYPIKLRIPGWCKLPVVQVNGITQENCVAGTFMTLNKTWKDQDVITLNFPMEVQLNKEVNRSVSVQRGPLVYALKIKEQWNVRTDYGNGFSEYEVLPLSEWSYALDCDTLNAGASFTVVKNQMPLNPFQQDSTPVVITANAKKITTWENGLNAIVACDPPYGPVSSDRAVEQISMVPFGAENIRMTCLPVLGTPKPVNQSFTDNFESSHANGWVNYNGSFMIDNGTLLATNTVGYSGSKSIQAGTNFTDCNIDVKVKVSATGDGGVIFRASKLSMGADEYRGYYVGINAATKQVLLGKAGGSWTLLKSANAGILADTWYQLRVVVKGSTIKVYVDNMNLPLIFASDLSFTAGAVGVRCYGSITSWDDYSVKSTVVSDVKDAETSQVFKLYPNPAGDFIDLVFPGNNPINSSVEIVDVNGKLIESYKKSADLAQLRLNTRKLIPGIYFVQVNAGENNFQSKFIKE